jgi:GPH family glycoside/pentoside/hexuronide:cation symporter
VSDPAAHRGTPSGLPPKIGRPDLFLYGSLALPLAFAGLPVYLHAPDFYATSYGVSLASLGAVLLGLRIVDAVQDPLIGAFSDAFAARRKMILLAGAFMLLAGFAGLFNPPALPVGGHLAWFAVSVFICTTGFSILSINYQALGGIWPASSSDRTRITGTREALGLVGILMASVLPSVLRSTYDAAAAFQVVTLALAVLLISGGWLFLRWFAKGHLAPAPSSTDESQTGPVSGGFRSLLRGGWARRFYGIYFISNFASAIPAVLVLFYIRDRLAAESWTGLFLLVYFLSGAASMPVWQMLGRRVGTARAWGISMIVAVVTFVWAFTLGAGDIVPFVIVCVLSGSALGADLALPPALLADRIERAGDQAIASRYFAGATFFAKASFALATGLSLPMLDALGYVPGQPAVAAVGLYLSGVYALAPCAIKIVAAVWLLNSLNAVSEKATP